MDSNINIDDIIFDMEIKIVNVWKDLNIEEALSTNRRIHGVYIFWIDSGKAYIGKSEKGMGISGRLCDHTRIGWVKKIIVRVNIYETMTEGQAGQLEKIMIHKLNPELNTIHKLEKKVNKQVNRDYLIKRLRDIYKESNPGSDISNFISFFEKSVEPESHSCAICRNRPIDFYNYNIDPFWIYFEFAVPYKYRICPVSKWSISKNYKNPFYTNDNKCFVSEDNKCPQI